MSTDLTRAQQFSGRRPVAGTWPASPLRGREFSEAQAFPASAIGKSQVQVRQIPTQAIDWTFTIRTLNVVHLERLTGAERLPALKVWEVEPDRFLGIDGYHRWHLAKLRDEDTVVASLHHFPQGQDGERAFEAACIQSNVNHGLPLTKAERDSAIHRFWVRWGRCKDRPDGETLESVGRMFNLSRQRVHQIVTDRGSCEAPDDGRGFSSFGRFTAATRRIATLMADTTLLEELIRERPDDVLSALGEVDAVIAGFLSRHRRAS